MDGTESSGHLNMLGEKLYNAIYPQYSEMAGKLTGMLLELPVPLLEQMLQDENLLSEGLKKALSALQQTAVKRFPEFEGDDNSASTDTLGEKLYDLVDVYNTGHSEKITGMLLELNKEDVKKLLIDSKWLEEQICIALKTLEKEDVSEKQELTGNNPLDVKEQMGEKLFAIVEEIDPENCADITGMLLEMDLSSLQTLIMDKAALEAAVKKAQAAMGQVSKTNFCSPLQNPDEDSDPDSETEKLGEGLYNYISATEYGDQAEKITGILLEMPRAVIRNLLTLPKELDEKIQMATLVLKDNKL
ncbi:uncharacterized protein LOC102356072 [Latimeria chalumnae]|uniref:uncharacterized protein LOC102356072 n=1 Tax=Latimeria chalumnae TaxID=7897 RepID=UPI0006D8DF8F|nr:PREDICTED: uncharacterized protein LOC102356072 [Latimeria chalumnae]|eukprot:XP_014352095.1 PREDICTED: uncharacterized protein LOC102356072 [Latimeria chalumnae]